LTADPVTADSDRIPRYVLELGFVVVLGSIMSILDTTIVNVALDTLARDLHSTIAQIQWVVTGYMLALAAVIPVSGWAARRFGPKPVWLTSLVLFTLGSMLCGLATSTPELVFFRVLQGVGGGMIMPVGQMMLAQAAGPKRMGRVMSIIGVPMMLAPIFGPTIGGLILENMSWRWIFFVNVPIGVIALIAGIRVLPKVARQKTESLDFLGLALMSTGLPLLTYGLAEIASVGTIDSPKVIVPCLLGVALIIAFVFHALRAKRPLLNMHLYTRPTFSSASLAMFLLGAAMFGSMILLPYYWQTVRHESVVATGLLTAPQGLGMAVMLPMVGKLTDRYGGGILALFGVVLTTVMTIPFVAIGAHTPIAYLSVIMFLRGVGIGFGFMPAMTAAYASLKHSEISDAAPQLNVLNRVGGSIGTAILAVVLQRELVGAFTPAAQASAYGTAFLFAAGMTLLAIGPCVVLMLSERKARAANAMAEREAIDTGAVVEALV
jgi:EmrB/QacA subfamily drug resistance transporter